MKYGDGWKVNIVCEFHNHEVVETLVGHPYVGRLSGEAFGWSYDREYGKA